MADEQPLGAVHLTRPRRSVGSRLLRATLREKGQALVEFAMVVPLLLLLVLGVADFGLAYNYKNDQTSMANQALRYAVVNSCTVCGGQSIEDYVKTTADSPELEHGNSSGSFGIQSPGVKIHFCLPPGSSGLDGEPLEAKATTSYNWLPLLNLGNVTIESTAVGRIEPGAHYNPGATNAYAQNGDPDYPLGLQPC